MTSCHGLGMGVGHSSDAAPGLLEAHAASHCGHAPKPRQLSCRAEKQARSSWENRAQEPKPDTSFVKTTGQLDVLTTGRLLPEPG